MDIIVSKTMGKGLRPLAIPGIMDGIKEKIASLKKEKNAIILAHNYTSADVQDVADLVGDSLGLSIEASQTDADVIVFCGVTFMGETAKILSPDKKVLIPRPDAVCDMASMCSPEAIAEKRKEMGDVTVVGYVNTTGPTKTQMDICCTSGNALKIVESITEKDILFVPDRNLGRYVSEKYPEKNITLWDGCCPIHDELTSTDIQELIDAYPNAFKMAHPECRKEVLDLMDYIGSTEAMLKQIAEVDNKEIIVITEVGMRHRMELKYPERKFIFPEKAICQAMKFTTLESIVECLENMSGEIILDEKVIKDAYKPVKIMTEVK